jgi:hypothetical protein
MHATEEATPEQFLDAELNQVTALWTRHSRRLLGSAGSQPGMSRGRQNQQQGMCSFTVELARLGFGGYRHVLLLRGDSLQLHAYSRLAHLIREDDDGGRFRPVNQFANHNVASNWQLCTWRKSDTD